MIHGFCMVISSSHIALSLSYTTRKDQDKENDVVSRSKDKPKSDKGKDNHDAGLAACEPG